MFSRPSPDRGPDHQLILALLKHPYGPHTKTIAKALGTSQKAAYQRLATAAADDWLATLNALRQPIPPKPDADRHTPWVLNLNRPGIDAVLEYLHIEHGAETTAYRRYLEDPSLRHQREFNDHQQNQRQAAASDDIDAIRTALAGFDTPMHPRIVRAHAAALRTIWATPTRLESTARQMHSLITSSDWDTGHPSRSAQRYVDWLHRMIHLSEELPDLPEPPAQDEDARPHLVALARTAETIAQTFRQEAAFFAASDDLGFHQHQLAARLADHQQHQLGAKTSFPITTAEADQKLSSYADLKHQITTGHPTPDGSRRPYLRYGGTPAPSELGTAGEGLITLELHTQADAALAVRDEILRLDGMTSAYMLVQHGVLVAPQRLDQLAPVRKRNQ